MMLKSLKKKSFLTNRILKINYLNEINAKLFAFIFRYIPSLTCFWIDNKVFVKYLKGEEVDYLINHFYHLIRFVEDFSVHNQLMILESIGSYYIPLIKNLEKDVLIKSIPDGGLHSIIFHQKFDNFNLQENDIISIIESRQLSPYKIQDIIEILYYKHGINGELVISDNMALCLLQHYPLKIFQFSEISDTVFTFCKFFDINIKSIRHNLFLRNKNVITINRSTRPA